MGDAPEIGLDAEDAGEGGGDADGAAAVVAEGDGADAGGECRGGAAGGAAGGACEVPRVAVAPRRRLSVRPFQPNSGVVVLPRKTAPASRRRATTGASSAAGVSGLSREPLRVGWPAMSTLSLIVMGMPSSGESGVPDFQRAAAAWAMAQAPGGVDDLEGVQARFQRGDAGEVGLGDRDGVERAVAIGGGEVGEGQEGVGHCGLQRVGAAECRAGGRMGSGWRCGMGGDRIVPRKGAASPPAPRNTMPMSIEF